MRKANPKIERSFQLGQTNKSRLFASVTLNRILVKEGREK